MLRGRAGIVSFREEEIELKLLSKELLTFSHVKYYLILLLF
jgi:hypothetical protein